jgi:hypothetical protein
MLCAPTLPPSPICKQCVRVYGTGFQRHGYVLGLCLDSICLHLISSPVIHLITRHYAHFLIRTSIHRLASHPEATSHPKATRGKMFIAIEPPMICHKQQCSRNPSLGLNNGLITKTPNVIPGPVYIIGT